MTDFIENTEYEGNINEEEEIEKELLLREARLLYPDVEEWVLNMAIKAHLKLNGEKFVSDVERGNNIKNQYFQGREYKTELKENQ